MPKKGAYSSPPLPGRLKKPAIIKDRTTRREWETFIHDLIKRFRKVERNHSGNEFLYNAELSGPIERRSVNFGA